MSLARRRSSSTRPARDILVESRSYAQNRQSRRLSTSIDLQRLFVPTVRSSVRLLSLSACSHRRCDRSIRRWSVEAQTEFTGRWSRTSVPIHPPASRAAADRRHPRRSVCGHRHREGQRRKEPPKRPRPLRKPPPIRLHPARRRVDGDDAWRGRMTLETEHTTRRSYHATGYLLIIRRMLTANGLIHRRCELHEPTRITLAINDAALSTDGDVVVRDDRDDLGRSRD